METIEDQDRPTRTSDFLRAFAGSLTGARVTLAEIVATLADRGLGVLIAIFAIPNILPSTVPFGNVATGVPVLVFAVQLTFGIRRLVIPGILARRTLGTGTVKMIAPRVAGVLSWFERLLKPRLAWVTTPFAERLIGVVCILLAIVSTLPIPFAHNLPALGLMLVGLGLIERDGAAILAGLAIGMIGVILLGLVMFGLAAGLTELLAWL